MLVRAAFFGGVITFGPEADFEAYIADKSTPLCRTRPNAVRVESLGEFEADDGAPRQPMVLQIAYPSRAALEEALTSPIRAVSRETTLGLFELFEWRAVHATPHVADD